MAHPRNPKETTVIIAADQLFDGAAFHPGWLRVAGATIAEVGTGNPPEPPEYSAGMLVPGFVDVHAHGGGGAAFGVGGREGMGTVVGKHLSHGTTTMIASLVTAATEVLERQIDVLAAEVENGTIAGIHLEGPWLAPKYKGAHDLALLADPAPADVARLLDRGRGTIKMVTIAPELPGAMESIALMAERGVVAAVGHTDADYAATVRAIEAGAHGATHLFNAMPPLHHRSPGPVLALWRDPRVFVELIFDGVHLAPELAATVMNFAPERAVLVTDAMAAAGFGDGDYVLGDLPVAVRAGVARIAGTDTIAGSTLILGRAVQNAVAAGVDPALVLRAATSTPARYMGLKRVGRIAAGYWADLVVLDGNFVAAQVMKRGEWVV